MPGGRPSSYTPELGEAICAHLRTGMTVAQMCSQDGMPQKSALYHWLDTRPDFAEMYARARNIGYDRMADELTEIADDGRNDTQVDGEGRAIVDFDHIQRSRLRVDTRKWLLSKMLPKKYGDKLDMSVAGPDGGPLVLNISRTARKE